MHHQAHVAVFVGEEKAEGTAWLKALENYKQ